MHRTNFVLSIKQAERDLNRAQEEFERQIEITKLLLEGLSSAQVSRVSMSVAISTHFPPF